MEDRITRPELDFLARRAGLTLTDAQAEELIEVHPMIRRLAERVRGDHDRDRAAEPAHVFTP